MIEVLGCCWIPRRGFLGGKHKVLVIFNFVHSYSIHRKRSKPISPQPRKRQSKRENLSNSRMLDEDYHAGEKKHDEEMQGSSAKLPDEVKSRGKIVVSEDLTGDIIVKKHFEKRKGSTKVTPAERSTSMSIISEDLREDILIKASKVRGASSCTGNELVGCKINVWWPLDEMFYEGKVASFDPSNKMHQIDYDDGDREILDLTKECWQLLGSDSLSGHEQKTVAAPSASTETLSNRGRRPSFASKKKLKASKVRSASRASSGNELVGYKIKVWWPLDEMFYEGKVASFDPSNKMHQVDYDDGDREVLDLSKERWQLLGDENLSNHQQKKTVRAPRTLTKTTSVKASSPSKRELMEMWRLMLD